MGEEAVPGRRSPSTDGAELAPVGVALLLLLRLVALGDREIDSGEVERALSAACARLEDREHHHPTVLRALARHHRPPRTLVVAGEAGRDALLAVAGKRAPVDLTVAGVPEDVRLAGRFAAFDQRGGPGPARAYLCEGTSCRLPVREPAALEALLRGG